MNSTLTRIAMTTAGIMFAHQVASKAFRDAAFLAAWPVTTLPGMIAATAVLIVVLVPLVSRLFDRFSPAVVVSAGFALSAAGHTAEWMFYDQTTIGDSLWSAGRSIPARRRFPSGESRDSAGTFG